MNPMIDGVQIINTSPEISGGGVPGGTPVSAGGGGITFAIAGIVLVALLGLVLLRRAGFNFNVKVGG